MGAPTIDATGCSPNCHCEWATASDECNGEVSETCKAIGGFTERCPDQPFRSEKILDCRYITFESDTSTTGVCVLEDTASSDEFGYEQHGRYWITLSRISYE